MIHPPRGRCAEKAIAFIFFPDLQGPSVERLSPISELIETCPGRGRLHAPGTQRRVGGARPELNRLVQPFGGNRAASARAHSLIALMRCTQNGRTRGIAIAAVCGALAPGPHTLAVIQQGLCAGAGRDFLGPR
jgi:hypothetical protein